VATADGTTSWDGDRLKLAPSAEPGPLIDALIAERRREAAALEAYREKLRRAAPGESTPLPPPLPEDLDAEDLPPGWRPGKSEDHEED
jgi:hypothetical protein